MDLIKLFEDTYLDLDTKNRELEQAVKQLDDTYSGEVDIPVSWKDPDFSYHAEYKDGRKESSSWLKNGQPYNSDTSEDFFSDDSYDIRMELMDIDERFKKEIAKDLAKRFDLKEDLQTISSKGWGLQYTPRGDYCLKGTIIHHKEFPYIDIDLGDYV